MGRSRWGVIAGLLAAASVASGQLLINFESEQDIPYTLGSIIGQNDWTQEIANTDALGEIVAANGPSEPGNQCLQITESTDTNNRAIWLRRSIANQLAAMGDPATGILQYQYDVRWLNGQPNNSGVYTSPRLYNSGLTAGIIPAHWWGLDCQYSGSPTPDGASSTWVGNIDGSGVTLGNTYPGWTTWRWTIYFGTGTGAVKGQVLYLEVFDAAGQLIKPRQYRFDSYLPAGINDLTVMRLILNATDAGWNPPADRDVVQYDNIKITVTPGNPSAPPIANAGPDQSVPGGSVGGVVTLDASGSSPGLGDPGSLILYRWSNLAAGYYERTLAVTTEPVTQVILPNNTTTTIRLQIIDDTGLQAFDDMQVTVGNWSPASVPIDNVMGTFGIKAGDIYGTSRSNFALPGGDLDLVVMNQRTGLPDPTPDRQMLFDEASNLYFMTWYGSLKSLQANLADRWETPSTGNVCNENGAIVVGARYVYLVGRGANDWDHDGNSGTPNITRPPQVYAFYKSNGAQVWATPLTQDTGYGTECFQNRPNVTLLDNKLYVFGNPESGTGLNNLWVFQLDATTGAIDWANTVQVGNVNARWGNVALVPDLYGPGLHGLFAQGASEGEDDGVSDMIALQIDPTTGATMAWPPDVDAGASPYSRMIYSPETGALYSAGSWNWAGDQIWKFNTESGRWPVQDPNNTPDVASFRGSDFAEGVWDAAALSFDGKSIFAGGNLGRLHKYTDISDPNVPFLEGQAMDVDTYWFGDSAFRVGPRLIMLQNGEGRKFALTAFSDDRWWAVDPNDPANDRRFNHYVALLDVTNPPQTIDDAILDDGPVYIDNVIVEVDGASIYQETFDGGGWTAGPFFPQATAKGWVWTGTGDPTDPNNSNAPELVDFGPPRGLVLRLDPYGGYSGFVSGVKLALPGAPYGLNHNTFAVVFKWYQLREDWTDKLYIGEDTYPGPGSFQGDGSEPTYPAGTICGFNTDPEGKDGVYGVLLDPNSAQWQETHLTVDYLIDLVDIVTGPVGGPLTGFYGLGFPPILGNGADAVDIDELKFEMTATPQSSSGVEPQPEAAEALYQASKYLSADPNTSGDWSRDWDWVDGLSIAPNGDIYFMQFKGYDRRYTRLRITGEPIGPTVCPGDVNCDGHVTFADIDPFVSRLGCPQSNPAACGTPATCDWHNADVNDDGSVTFADIDPFVGTLGNTCP